MTVVFRYLATASLLLVAVIAISPAISRAHAQDVFKCINRDGEIAFQAVPCKPGMREQQIMIEPAPPVSRSPDYGSSHPHGRSKTRTPQQKPRAEVEYSYECRTQSGALFYRHSRCPASIDRSGLIGGRRGAPREAVSGRRIPRLEACRGMRSVGRDGREFDDVPSTYDRNLGRDPCRRY